MKRIDIYLLRSFLPPFVATFFIAVFVLILQILWVYIDDIIGKGSSLLFIMEMVFYLSMTLIPLALPIAVLISSVMVLGNMAERYELSSLKSAGVSLGRVMLPLLVFTSFVGLFSFVSSNYLIPIANLKGKTRLYDVRKQKPNLNLEAGRFNEDFEGYVIYAGSKSQDGRYIYDVMIYTSDYARAFQVVTAEKGQLYLTPDDQFMVMELENGHQYQEMEQEGTSGKTAFLRTEFGKWQKLFDLRQFNLERSDEASFRSHSTVLTIPQIRQAMDSVYVVQRERLAQFRRQASPFLAVPGQVAETPPAMTPVDTSLSPEKDTSEAGKKRVVTIIPDKPSRVPDELRPDVEKIREAWKDRLGRGEPVIIQQRPVLPGTEKVSRILETYAPEDQAQLLSRARVMARSVQGEAGSFNRIQTELEKNLAKYALEIHLKYSLAVICLIFLLIGAPMGAIVRKGGFGYPLLVAIGFFMLFMILNMLFKSLAEKLIITPWLGAWMPNLILTPLGLFLSVRAMNDARVFDPDKLGVPLRRLLNRWKKQ